MSLKDYRLTTPTGTRILAVKVPEDADNYFSGNNGKDWIMSFYNSKHERSDVILPKDCIEVDILGCITNNVVEFDCSSMVDFDGDSKYRDYLVRDYQLNTPSDSFLSFLHSKGVVTENKYGKEPPKYDVSKGDGSATKFLEWKNEESKVWKKILILKLKDNG